MRCFQKVRPSKYPILKKESLVASLVFDITPYIISRKLTIEGDMNSQREIRAAPDVKRRSVLDLAPLDTDWVRFQCISRSLSVFVTKKFHKISF